MIRDWICPECGETTIVSHDGHTTAHFDTCPMLEEPHQVPHFVTYKPTLLFMDQIPERFADARPRSS